METYRERLTNWIIGTFESIEDVEFKNQDAFVLVLLFDLKGNVFEEYFVISFVYKAYNKLRLMDATGGILLNVPYPSFLIRLNLSEILSVSFM